MLPRHVRPYKLKALKLNIILFRCIMLLCSHSGQGQHWREAEVGPALPAHRARQIFWSWSLIPLFPPSLTPMMRHPLAVPWRQRDRWSDSPGTGIVFSSCHRRASLPASVPSCPSGGLHDGDVLLLVAGRRRDDRERELHGASTSPRLVRQSTY